MANYHAGLLFNNSNVERAAFLKLEPADAIEEDVVRNSHNVFITEVTWCKCSAPPRHEFLVFYVKEKGTHRRSVILIERDVDQDWESGDGVTMDDGRVEAPRRPRKFRSSSSSIPDYSSMGSPQPPYDIMAFTHSGSDRFVHRIERAHEVVVRLEIRGEYFSVPQLVVLVNLVHNHHSDFTFFEYQCYWFAGIIYSVVKKKCPNSVTHRGPAYQKRGKFARAPIRKGKAWLADDFVRAFDEKDWPLFKSKLAENRIRANVMHQENTVQMTGTTGKQRAKTQGEPESPNKDGAEELYKQPWSCS